MFIFTRTERRGETASSNRIDGGPSDVLSLQDLILNVQGSYSREEPGAVTESENGHGDIKKDILIQILNGM